ncbi:MAG TPA: hypothetical protein VFA62_00215 [Acidimicrobiia bacterium]|nr:hypothetical protein [Acidimicrobiia bacterium]
MVTRASSATSRQSIEANVAATGSLPQSPAGSVVVVVGTWVVAVELDVLVLEVVVVLEVVGGAVVVVVEAEVVVVWVVLVVVDVVVCVVLVVVDVVVVCVVLVVVDVVVVVVVGEVNVHLAASNAPMSQRATLSQLPSTGRESPRSSVVIGMLL